MTTQNAIRGLEIAANGSEAARLAEKAAKFLGKATMTGPHQIVRIPEGASYMRREGNKVRFYDGQLPTNHAIKIEEGARFVQFPQYETHAFNVHYGEPTFDKEVQLPTRQSQ